MKAIKLLYLFIFMVLAGCAQNIKTYGIEDINSIPNYRYTSYLYSSGVAERLKAVLLLNPDAGIEVVPYSVQIINAVGTFGDAMDFMRKVPGYQVISVEGVKYKDKTIGYLLTQERQISVRNWLEVMLYERDGKIFFSVREQGENY